MSSENNDTSACIEEAYLVASHKVDWQCGQQLLMAVVRLVEGGCCQWKRMKSNFVEKYSLKTAKKVWYGIFNSSHRKNNCVAHLEYQAR